MIHITQPRHGLLVRLVFLFSLMLVIFWSSYGQNYALQFDGAATESQDYVDLPTLNGPSASAPFTLEAWVKPNASDAIWRTILEFGGDSPYFGLQSGLNFTISGTPSSHAISQDVWTHVAAAFDGTNLKLVVNGTELSSNVVTPQNSGVSAGIGYHEGDNAFSGWIDEIRVWNVYRDPPTINAQKDSELNGGENGLVAYYNFNEGTGTALNDLTANNYDGTLLNGDNTTPADGTANGPIWSTDVPALNPPCAVVIDRDLITYSYVTAHGATDGALNITGAVSGGLAPYVYEWHTDNTFSTAVPVTGISKPYKRQVENGLPGV